MINLDSLSQSELIMYVKQLERTKTDLTSNLRATEWSLDKQSKVKITNITYAVKIVVGIEDQK